MREAENEMEDGSGPPHRGPLKPHEGLVFSIHFAIYQNHLWIQLNKNKHNLKMSKGLEQTFEEVI